MTDKAEAVHNLVGQRITAATLTYHDGVLTIVLANRGRLVVEDPTGDQGLMIEYTPPSERDEALVTMLTPPKIPLDPFEVGYGRPDLERIHRAVVEIDNGHPSIPEIRNDLAYWVNSRQAGDREVRGTD